ncbi:MAG TPA: DUF4386 domain-containing protein [Gemmatimonadaceae bacterium]|nr:DUF4386 domain-containing protein [Gemmatimonadaceae bacterium]
MTRTTNARIAGITFLLYIAVGLTALTLYGRATDGEGVAAKLARIAEHAVEMRIAILLSFMTCFAALTLAVTLYAITRDEDHELAMLGMICRIAEGVLGGAFLVSSLGLLWLATARGTNAPEVGAARTLATFFLRMEGWSPTISATFFAVGSSLFSWLLLRGRMVPVLLARLGVIASVLLVVLLPMQLAGFPGGMVFLLMWLPMLVFEVVLALWFLTKGVAPLAAGA